MATFLRYWMGVHQTGAASIPRPVQVQCPLRVFDTRKSSLVEKKSAEPLRRCGRERPGFTQALHAEHALHRRWKSRVVQLPVTTSCLEKVGTHSGAKATTAAVASRAALP